MKRLFIMLVAILFIAVGCGTKESKDAPNTSGDNGNQTSPGNEGTGETLPTLEDLEDGVVEDITPLLNKLEFAVDVEADAVQANFNMLLKNNASEKMELGFSSGQQFEIVVRDSSGEEVFRYSEGMMFTEALEFKEINAAEELNWTFAWDYEGKAGKVEVGEYTATVTLLPMQINKTPIDANPFIKEVSFTIPGAEEASSSEPQDNNAFRNVEVSGSNGSYQITGEARVFEAQFSYHVEDGHNILVEETFVQVNEGAPSWSPFTIDVELEESQLPDNGTVTFVLYERSAKDGEPTNVIILPLEQFN